MGTPALGVLDATVPTQPSGLESSFLRCVKSAVKSDDDEPPEEIQRRGRTEHVNDVKVFSGFRATKQPGTGSRITLQN